MGDRKIEIITNEIRNSIKNGDSKMVCGRINQLKNNKLFEKRYLKKTMRR